MKKIWKLIKKSWEIIILVITWLITCFVVFIQKLRVSDKVQALAIITLVFITLYYAIQTHKLVQQEKLSLEEERKRRITNFGEKRLKEFYLPLIRELTNILGALKGTEPEKIEDINESFHKFIKIYLDKHYLCKSSINEKIKKFHYEFIPELRLAQDKLKEKKKEESAESILKEFNSVVSVEVKNTKNIIIEESKDILSNIKENYKYSINKDLED
ncbi:MAG: hypothetical protein ACOC5T_00595 [Elusimicrobiota bacterium]